ncbi:hypothetical protein MHB71_00175 [Paenibacillus sp. FSL H7-0940]|uniref:hypothetical protein n=1 Tax=Paenibacillus sp. FSL H7-0940 TaxID=2921443 RepID=UPI0030ED57B9
MKKLVLSFLLILLLVTSSQLAPATAATKYDFKNVNWGMTVNQVKKKEKSKLLDQGKVKDFSYLKYKTTGFRESATLTYIFYKNKLARTVYDIYPNDTKKTPSNKLDKYFSIKRDLLDEYDAPFNNKDIITSSGKNIPTYIGDLEDMVAGKVAFITEWFIDKKRTSIVLLLAAENKVTFLQVTYENNTLKYDLDELMRAQGIK